MEEEGGSGGEAEDSVVGCPVSQLVGGSWLIR